MWRQLKNNFLKNLTKKRLPSGCSTICLKKHKEYKFQRDTPHESCTCEICENVHLFVLAINGKLKEKDKRLPTSVKDLVEEFSCDIENVECMKSKCGNCLTW